MNIIPKGRKAKRERERLIGFYNSIVRYFSDANYINTDGMSNKKLKALCEATWNDRSKEDQSDYLAWLDRAPSSAITGVRPVKIVWNPKVGA